MAVRLVRQIRAETGLRHGAVKRVAVQLGFGVESVRSWVSQADVDDGQVAGVTTVEAARVKQLEQEIRELRRANEILRRASAFFAAETIRSRMVATTISVAEVVAVTVPRLPVSSAPA